MTINILKEYCIFKCFIEIIMVVDVLSLILCFSVGAVGAKRGLFFSVIKLVSTLGALIISYYLLSGALEYIEKNTAIYDGVRNVLDGIVLGEDKLNKIGFIENALPVFSEIRSNISGSVSTIVIKALTFIVLFVSVKLIVLSVGKLLDLFIKSSPLDVSDKFCGMIFGLLKGILFCLLAFTLIKNVVIPLFPASGELFYKSVFYSSYNNLILFK